MNPIAELQHLVYKILSYAPINGFGRPKLLREGCGGA